jgi:membrane-bound metal-dependent hydrolase YbcI (DUF457 family)
MIQLLSTMVLGHFGVGLGAKRFAPKISLGTYFIAAQWVDLLWPVLLLLNVEKVTVRHDNPKFPLDFVYYPFTHSLLMGIVWGLCFGLLYWLAKKDRRGAIVLGFCVVSHWLLDLIVHAPDLPLFPGDSPKLGLGLWNNPLATAVVEGLVFIIGLSLYLKATRAKNTTGKWSLWLLVLLLVANQVAGALSPLPPSAHAIGWAVQYQWIFVLLGYWVDRNRQPVSG